MTNEKTTSVEIDPILQRDDDDDDDDDDDERLF